MNFLGTGAEASQASNPQQGTENTSPLPNPWSPSPPAASSQPATRAATQPVQQQTAPQTAASTTSSTTSTTATSAPTANTSSTG